MSATIPPELSAKLSSVMNLKQVQLNTTVPPYDTNSQILNQASPTKLIDSVQKKIPAFGFENASNIAPRLPQTKTLNNLINQVATKVDYDTPIRGLVDNLLNKTFLILVYLVFGLL